MPSYTHENWETTTRFEELNKLASDRLGIALRNWQCEGTAKLLSGKDLLLLIATGSGKSTIFQLYALARPDSIILVISPLKLLEKNMVSSLVRKGITAVALNADTISAAKEVGEDLWEQCARGQYQVVLCSPEKLASGDMNDLIAKRSFQRRVGLVVIDEAHLIPVWGGDGAGRPFRSAYNAIGTIKSRLQSQTVYLALSATLMPGKPTSIVKSRLGFEEGPKFELMRLDCERRNVRFILRRLQHSYTQSTFADLDWLVPTTASCPKDIAKTIVYVDNVPRGHALVAYLRSLLPPLLQPLSHVIIFHLHASTCAQCKDDALDNFSATESHSLRIVVATEAFGCGVDISDIVYVINLGTPRNLDALLQRIGRVARALLEGWGIAYISPRLWDALMAELGLADPSKSSRSKPLTQDVALGEDELQVCKNFKEILKTHFTRGCIVHRVNLLYGNPIEGKPQRCEQCSGCAQDQVPSPRAKTKPDEGCDGNKPQGDPGEQCADPIPHILLEGRLGRPTKQLKDEVQSQIAAAALDVWVSVRASKSTQFYGSQTMLSTSQCSTLANCLVDLETTELVQRALGSSWRFWPTHGEQLATRVLAIRKELIIKLENKQKATREKRQATYRLKRQVQASESQPEHTNAQDSEDGILQPDEPMPQASGSQATSKRRRAED